MASLVPMTAAESWSAILVSRSSILAILSDRAIFHRFGCAALAHPTRLAISAYAPVPTGQIDVITRERVTAFAGIAVSVARRNRSQHVFARAHRLQVIGIYARRHTAQMVEVELRWDDAPVRQVGISVSQACRSPAARNSETPIPRRVLCGSPEPASTGRLIYLRPKRRFPPRGILEFSSCSLRAIVSMAKPTPGLPLFASNNRACRGISRSGHDYPSAISPVSLMTMLSAQCFMPLFSKLSLCRCLNSMSGIRPSSPIGTCDMGHCD